MRKALIIFILITSSQLLTAQEKCETESEGFIELNTINKCTTTSSAKQNLKTTRHLSSKKISSRIRFLKIKTKSSSTLKIKSDQLPKEILNK